MIAGPSRITWAAPIFGAAVVTLFAALWGALVHLGIPIPDGPIQLRQEHGQLVAYGFLGSLIALERAVALRSAWAWTAPIAAAAGSIWLLAGGPASTGRGLFILAGVGLTAIYVAVHRIQPSYHNVVMGFGALCWIGGAILWVAGRSAPTLVPWIVGFLVLTIAGERLELSRMIMPPKRASMAFVVFAAVLTAGVVLSTFAETPGVQLAGVGLALLSIWLVRYDIARRTVRRTGVTRYMAAALLAGYLWLMVAAVLWLSIGGLHPAPGGNGAGGYDAMLHAIFLGFVISMVFAHAPVIVPAVLGTRFVYHGSLYVPLVLLHGSLVLRVFGGDAFGDKLGWQLGGVLNEVAILVFLPLAVVAVARGHRRRTVGAVPKPRTEEEVAR